MMDRFVAKMMRAVLVGGLGALGLVCPVQAHARGQGNGHGSRPRLAETRAHTAEDSLELLLFGLGVFGCSAVCAVESHREERQPSEQMRGLAAIPAL